MPEGLLYGLPLAEYVADPAPAPSLSHGIAHALLTYSPRHAWVSHPKLNPDYESENNSRFDIGTIVHAILLEDNRSRIVVVDAKTWQSKDAKAQRDLAWAEGKLPILAHKLTQVDAMVDAARVQIAASELKGIFADGDPEVTMVWKEGSSWCRTRPDWVTKDHRLLIDLKTTDAAAEPGAWSRGVLPSQGYELQDALGRRGIKALTGEDATLVFMVQETEAPYALSLVSLDPQYIAYADRRLDLALQLWGECRATNVWPCYPRRVTYVEPPSWLTYRLEEQAERADEKPRDDGEGETDQL